MSFGIGPLRILDFDSENRALSYLGGDFTTKELTRIAWSFGDPEHVEVRTLGFGERPVEVLEDFLEAYDEADVVTGHWLVGHDLPLINAMLLEDGHEPLSQKLVSDTKAHLLKRSGISSSQKNLGAYLGCSLPKVEMTDADWRESYRLTEAGRKLTEERVVGDVLQHMWLRRNSSSWVGSGRQSSGSRSPQAPVATPRSSPLPHPRRREPMRTIIELGNDDLHENLPEPTADDLLDEIRGLCGALMARDVTFGSGIKAVVTSAWRTGRIRPFVPAPTMRVASIEDLWHDLEEAVVQLRATGATRRRLNPVLRDLPKAPRTEAQQRAAAIGRANLEGLRTARTA